MSCIHTSMIQPEVFNDNFIDEMLTIKVTNRAIVQLRKEYEAVKEFSRN